MCLPFEPLLPGCGRSRIRHLLCPFPAFYPVQLSRSGIARSRVWSSWAISWATLNWGRIRCCISHLAVALALFGQQSSCGNCRVRSSGIKDALSCSGQCRMTCLTVCEGCPQGHLGSIPGTPLPASQALSPMTSVRSRNRAVAVALLRPSYRRSRNLAA